MLRYTVFVAAILVPLAGRADPRAMMMGASWMQARQPVRPTVSPQPMTLIRPVVKPTVKAKPVVKPTAQAKSKTKTQKTATQTKKPPQTAETHAQPVTTGISDAALAAAALESQVEQPAAASSRGWFGNLMHHFGRAVGKVFRRSGPSAQKTAKVASASTVPPPTNRKGYVIPLNSLPVGLLLTPYRLGTLNRPLNPQTLADMRSARLITDREYELFMTQAQMMMMMRQQ